MDESLCDLPQGIQLNIFLRLPVQSVLDSRRVCKAWKNFLDHQLNASSPTNYFAHLHLQFHHRGLVEQHQHPLSLDSEYYNSHNDSDSNIMCFVSVEEGMFWYLEYHDNDDDENSDKYSSNIQTRRRVNLKAPKGMHSFAGSCNGLICLSIEKRISTNHEFYGDPVYICNPITREFVNLPGIKIYKNKERKNYDDIDIVHGFGYHPLTNEYKVVRICYTRDPLMLNKNCLTGRVEVYTLGNGRGWRNIGEINYCLVRNYKSKSVCVNGCLHWLTLRSSEIVTFDLADEKFRLFPTPCLSGDNNHREIAVLRRCLYLVHSSYEYPRVTKATIWILKRNHKEENGSKGYDANNQHYQSRNWGRECNIDPSDGEILIKEREGRRNAIWCKYNPKTRVRKEILEHDNPLPWLSLIHDNSFVSLKALGEENVKTMIESMNEDGDGLHSSHTSH